MKLVYVINFTLHPSIGSMVQRWASMRRFPWRPLLWLLAIALIGGKVIWPLVDRLLMEIPVTDAITALRTGNSAKLASSFTADARVSTACGRFPVREVIDRFKPWLGDAAYETSVRFGGYSHLKRWRHTAITNVTLIYDYRNDDLPYRNRPFRWTEEVTLEKQGLFTWKIQELHVKTDTLNAVLHAKIVGPE